MRYALALAAGRALPGAGAAAALDYPNHPVRLIVPFAPGGGADSIGRLIAREIAKWRKVVGKGGIHGE